MQKYTYLGETFLLDDTKGCYIEVKFRDTKMYVGVNLQGTAEFPYTWGPEEYATTDGLSVNYGGQFRNVEEALNKACGNMVHNWREAESRKAFKPQEACEELHDYVKNLPGE